ncbi:hypothetical protein A5765_19230 [Mycolicibacterium celeriflavum]|uniref:DUF6390 family protein n=1 Tax=Mycolicibacterium celeriflavum TaxID=1249101 RepID=UPI0007FE5F60|nr:DUF6390 family protein [Mycolicibacterium celeriflavum]OBG22896.1 hypothetical protein A5765_19230 [Mycolicibacterium celeriflavum]
MNALTSGQILFGRYAYPPNELGYCGPTDVGGTSGLASHAREFDGAWPYLAAIADAVGASDALDEDVVASYWIGGPALSKVAPAELLGRLRAAFKGQVTGLLDAVSPTSEVLAHHSFHVFVVYPWVRFLRRDAPTALRVMQDCRIRWGTVESVDGEHAVLSSRPLRLDDGKLTLGPPETERVRWRKGDLSLAPAPTPGTSVSAHWDWICGTLGETECDSLAAATQSTLDVVNSSVGQGVRS